MPYTLYRYIYIYVCSEFSKYCMATQRLYHVDYEACGDSNQWRRYTLMRRRRDSISISVCGWSYMCALLQNALCAPCIRWHPADPRSSYIYRLSFIRAWQTKDEYSTFTKWNHSIFKNVILNVLYFNCLCTIQLFQWTSVVRLWRVSIWKICLRKKS